MDGPLVAFDGVAEFWREPPYVGCYACKVEFFATRDLEVEPDGFAVRAPEFVAGNFVGDGAFVNQTQAGAVGADVPDAIDEMPGTFVTEHEERRICGRELNVIEPVVAAMNEIRFAGGNFEREEEMRQLGVVNGFEPIRAGLAAGNLGRALAESAGKEGFVSVDGQAAPTARKLGNRFCDARIEMG